MSSAWCRIESVAPPACGIVHQALSILGQSVPPCVACTCCLVSCPWRLAAVHHFGFTETVEQQQQRTVHQLPMCCWPDRKDSCCQKTAATTDSTPVTHVLLARQEGQVLSENSSNNGQYTSYPCVVGPTGRATAVRKQQQQRTVHQLPMCCWPDRKDNCFQKTAATTDSTPVTHVLLADRKDNCCQKTAAETVSYILSLCADRQQQERLCQLHCLSLCVDRSNCCQCQTSTTKTVSVTCLSLCLREQLLSVSDISNRDCVS